MINLSIRARLLLLVAFPVVLLLIYIGIDLRENYRLMHEMEETAVLTGFSGVSNDLVHSLQAERGRSVGWLNGHADRKPIEDTRADTDRAQAALNDFIRTAELPAAIRSDLGSLQNDLATLAALRLSVDDKSISPADSLARYTKAIDGLFRFVTVLQQNSSDPVLARDVSAMLGLLCQKEFAGRERAMINGALAAGSFAPGSRDRAMLGLGQQQACQSQFERFAESFMVEAYTMIRTTPEYSGSIGLRERILAPDADLAALNIPAAEWFRQSSLHIDAIKGMLDTVALTLQAKVAQRVEDARTHLLIGTGIALGLLVVLAVLLTMTLRSILSPIRRLQQLMDRMSDTFDLSARANIRGTHEVARMARSFDRLVDAFEQAVGAVAQRKLVEDVVGVAGEAFGTYRQRLRQCVEAVDMQGHAADAGQITLARCSVRAGEQRPVDGHRLRRVFDAVGSAQAAFGTQRIGRVGVAGGKTFNPAVVPGRYRVEQAHAALMRNAGGDGGAVEQWHAGCRAHAGMRSMRNCIGGR